MDEVESYEIPIKKNYSMLPPVFTNLT